MGLLRGAGKAVKFTFVTMPGAMLGVNQLRMGGALIRDLWRSIGGEKCPVCSGSTLRKMPSEGHADDESALLEWRCGKCDYVLFAPGERNELRDLVSRERKAQVLLTRGNLPAEDIRQIARGHVLQSRALYCASAIAVVGAVYQVASGGALLTAFAWLSFGLAFFIRGLKFSYRAWQVRNNVLYVKGAFWHFLQHEKWLS